MLIIFALDHKPKFADKGDAQVTFYNPRFLTMPSTCSTSLLDWGHAERPACKLVYKTSFSRLNPGSRGQATIISDPSEVLKRTPTTNDQSDKLPTSSGPSFVSGRLGHQRRHWNRPRTHAHLAVNTHLEASRSIFSSRFLQNRHKRKMRRANFLLLQKTCGGPPVQDDSPSPIVRRPVPSAAATRPRPRQDTNMVELSGIEPLTPCLQSRCSPS
jgi:hypothetical protein